MPGVGGSPDPQIPYRPWWVAYAAKEILLQNRYTKVDVLGVSWGGGPAQQFAWQYKRMTRKAKTLVIMGGNDHIVPVANGHILNYALKNSKLKILDGAGHLFLLTRRDETVEMIRDFFGEPEVAMPHVEPVMLPSVAASYNHKNEFDPAFVKSDI